jgi:integrase
MPVTAKRQGWEVALRKQVRTLATGWNVVEARGKVRLKMRPPGAPEQSTLLPFRWAEDQSGDAYVRIRNIYALVGQGHSLSAAAEIAAGKAPSVERDWAGAVERFKQQKISHGATIKPITWESAYAPVLADAVALLTCRKPPTNPADLLDLCIRRWEPGSRMRQIRAQSLAQFLRHCVTREQFPGVWHPPADLKSHVGMKPAGATSDRGGDPLTDRQIINLIATFPTDAAGGRWADAVRLLAELGLRPIELLHLTVKLDPITSEPYWWCSYEKRSGGGRTAPRRVHPLPLVNDQGEVQQWHLMARWQAGLVELPPLQSGNGASDGLATYLNRQPGWKSLRAELAAKGERAVPYSFRHSYSLRAHQRGIDAGSVAHSMGHSIEVHCRSYAWASAAGTATAFARANSTLAAAPV